MLFDSLLLKKTAVLMLACSLLCSFGIFRKKKYEHPITKDTLQPDKVLFDRAIGDIEHGRFEVARLTLNTLINTYDSSEFLAKAKLAIADSWYREGGAHGLAQAEAEYKDFILFYPQMEEAAESQWKVCQIHYKQMEKADRDSAQGQRTEDECRTLVTQFPNSKFLPQAQQMLRDTQEVLGDKEFRTGAFYHSKGSYPAAANRLTFVADQYPLFSGSDEALWQAADSFNKMGDRFEEQSAADYTRIVKDYPLSRHAEDAKSRLEAMKRPVPVADPATVARMQYDLDNRVKPGIISRSLDLVRSRPDVHMAAKQGAPAMSAMRPPTPVSVPQIATTASNGVVTANPGTGSDVTANVSTDASGLDNKPDARQNPAAAQAAVAAAAAAGAPTAVDGKTTAAPGEATKNQAVIQLPTNHVAPKQKKKTKKQLQQEEDFRKKQEAAAAAAAPKPDVKPEPQPGAIKQQQQ